MTFYGEDRRVYADALLSAEASTPSLLPSSSLPLLAFRVDFVVAGIGVLRTVRKRVVLFFGFDERCFAELTQQFVRLHASAGFDLLI